MLPRITPTLLGLALLAATPLAAQEIEGPPAPTEADRTAAAASTDTPPAPQPSEPASKSVTSPPPPQLAQSSVVESNRRAAQMREFDRRRIRAVLFSEIPYVVSTAVGALAIVLSSDECLGKKDCHGSGPYDWRGGAEDYFSSPAIFPVFATISVFTSSVVTTAVHWRSKSYRTRFSTTLLGSVLGLGLDVGLMAILYFHTESAPSLIFPSLAGFLVLPSLGGAIGARLSIRDKEPDRVRPRHTDMGQARVSISPPIPIAVAASGGRSTPGIAIGGSF